MNFFESHGIACNMSDYSVFGVSFITVNEILPGFRSLFKCTIPDSGKVKLIFFPAYYQYQHTLFDKLVKKI